MDADEPGAIPVQVTHEAPWVGSRRVVWSKPTRRIQSLFDRRSGREGHQSGLT